MKATTIVILLAIFLLASSNDYCGKYNCYQLLGVEADAEETIIRKAFREMAKKYHPDKNQQQDTTQIFQMINKALEILTDEKSRFKYNLHLQNPQQSDFYHEYRYYSKKIIQDPQINPYYVVIAVITLISTLQYVMRKQMYYRAIQSITSGHDFKNKVNERCGNNKKLKQSVKQEMIKEISIEGGYSLPTYKDLLFYKIFSFPVTIFLGIKQWARWIYRYNIKKEEYTFEDQNKLTMKALSIYLQRWQNIPQQERKELINRKLWIKQNKLAYQQQMKNKWLEQLKIDNPKKYQMVIKHLKKNQ